MKNTLKKGLKNAVFTNMEESESCCKMAAAIELEWVEKLFFPALPLLNKPGGKVTGKGAK
jgi:hypothetical protein